MLREEIELFRITAMTGKKEKKNGGGHSVDEEAGNVRRAMI